MRDKTDLGLFLFADAALIYKCGKSLVATQRKSPKRSLKAAMMGVTITYTGIIVQTNYSSEATPETYFALNAFSPSRSIKLS